MNHELWNLIALALIAGGGLIALIVAFLRYRAN